MNPPPLSLASKCPVVAGRDMAHLSLIWLNILLGKSLCLGSNAKVTALNECTQSVISIPYKGSRKEGKHGPTLPCLPPCLSGGAGSGTWLICHTCLPPDPPGRAGVDVYAVVLQEGGYLLSWEISSSIFYNLFHPSSWSSARTSCMEGLF